MSYSFNVRGATKAEAKAGVDAELAKVVEHQPIHAIDRAQAQAAVDAFIDLMPADEHQDVQVSMHGSVGWTGTESEPVLVSGGMGFTVSLVPRG